MENPHNNSGSSGSAEWWECNALILISHDMTMKVIWGHCALFIYKRADILCSTASAFLNVIHVVVSIIHFLVFIKSTHVIKDWTVNTHKQLLQCVILHFFYECIIKHSSTVYNHEKNYWLFVHLIIQRCVERSWRHFDLRKFRFWPYNRCLTEEIPTQSLLTGFSPGALSSTI